MKKIILSFSIAFILTMITAPSYAVDITAGATTWYSWWDYKDPGSPNPPTFNPTLLYGPALSVKFNDDFNLTFVFLYGRFEVKETTGTKEITRADSDMALNYRLNNYFKLFIGAKYMSYKMTDFDHSSVGPGGGISAVFPLGGNFFMLGNISGLYLWGYHKDTNSSSNMNEYGANSSLSLAYYIESASTTINLGGRYQYFKTVYADQNMSKQSHHFYGVTLSATYTFSL